MKKYLFILCALFIPMTGYGDDKTPVASKAPGKLEQLLYPTVRVLNGRGGGSGIIIYSEDREKTGEYQTFVFTNHHVIDRLINIEKKWDNLLGKYVWVENNELAEVELFNYSNGGATVTRNPVKAEIIAYIEDEDIALLKLIYTFKVPFTAKLVPADRKLELFQEVYAVGCPMLVDPIFTKGEITDLSYMIENRIYVMTSADIIWGNSGGGLFAKFDDGYYYIGIPSRGTIAYFQAVTYMGYSITPERLRSFITSQKLDFIIDPTKTPTQCLEERKALRNKSAGSADPPDNSPSTGDDYDDGNWGKKFLDRTIPKKKAIRL